MFDHHPSRVDLAVGTLLLAGKRVLLGGLGGFTGVGVELLQALVASVGEHLHAGMHARLALLEEVKVMAAAFAHPHRQDAPGAPLQEHLGLQGVTLLLARV